MKHKHLILPAAALVASVVVLGLQERSISKLESEEVLLKQAIAKQKKVIAETKASEASKKTAVAVKETGPLDWRKFLASLSRDGDSKVRKSFRERLETMTRDELVAALDEIAALGLSEEEQFDLDTAVMSELVEKDLEYVLTRFLDRIHRQDSWPYGLSTWFGDWAAKDLSKATAWFNGQIAAGKFESKTLDAESTPMMLFEAALLGKLLGADFAAANVRLANLTEKERKSVLEQTSASKLDAAGQMNLAKLIRTQIPEVDRLKILGGKADDFVSTKDGFSKVTEFLDRIQATPEERTAAAKSSAGEQFFQIVISRKATREDIESMRAWVGAQSPQSTSAVTGQALSQTLSGDFAWSFADAAKRALEYNQAAGNDEVLKTFLGGYHAGKHKEEARVLAGQITDPEVRDSILKKLK